MEDKKCRVLVVDDDALYHMLFKTAWELYGSGRELQVARGAEEALELLDKETFYLVFADRHLGSEDFWDLLKTRTDLGTPTSPQIFLTSHGEAPECPFPFHRYRFINKPKDLEEFRKMFESVQEKS